MDNLEISNLFEEFLETYDIEKNDSVWAKQSKEFQDFWNNRIMNNSQPGLNDEEIDKIIKILDKNAKGHTSADIAVARAMVPQGAWRRMFKELKINLKLKICLNKILNEPNTEKLTEFINELYLINETKNNLTGPGANALNTLLFAYNPLKFISMISLKDRQIVIESFNFNGPNFEKDSQGKKVVLSNIAIIEGFKKILGKKFVPRTLTDFLYLKIKNYWKMSDEVDFEEAEVEISKEKIEQVEEKLYQKLIHRNFKMFFQDLEYYDPESQNDNEGHYTCEAGTMDFFCKDQNGNFVVIELKKEGKDTTIGQICRYMGWVKETLCKEGQEVSGMVISEVNDPYIQYSIRVLPKVTFKKMGFGVHPKKYTNS